MAYQGSFVYQGPLGTRESIVHISLEVPLQDPPLVRASFVLCDSDLVRCESKCVDGQVQSVIYLLACAAFVHTPISGAIAILNATRRNEDGTCGLNALLTYV